jgi:Ca2+-binding RTX toxin-like protein
MATITGTSGNDVLNGTSGDDTILGLAGNDTLNTIGGTDFYDGGTGNDTFDLAIAGAAGVTVSFAAGTISGGLSGTFVNIERVLGTGGADSLIGAAGNQNLSAKGGNDRLEGGDGNDTLWGGNGADSFVFREFGTANADRVSDFASGTDKIVLDAAVMSALGANGVFAAGDDRFAANSTGTAQDAEDRVVFNTATNQLFYDADGNGSGAAVLIATLVSGATLVATDIVAEGGSSGGSGTINGTEGDDSLTGTSGNDTIDGRGGNDTIVGLEGADLLVGGSGNDDLSAVFDNAGDRAADTLDGGLGDDTYRVQDDGDVILADPGGIDWVIAVNANWTLGAGLENLELRDGAGAAFDGTGNELDNVILGASEGGTLLGMGGNDRLVMRIAENEGRAEGGDGNDTLSGEGVLIGDAGNDELNPVPQDNPNTLSGGSGADLFVFDDDPLDEGSHHITDFASSVDTIRLDATAMPALGSSGRLSTADGRFAANSSGTAQDTSDRVIYNTVNGDLWYDGDGSGTGAAALIVTLQGAPDLAATDIEVVNGSAPGNVINGTAGPDTLTGTSGNDTINGLEGNDLFLAGSTGGNDVINGGAGRDSIEFKERATSAITVDFVTGTITGGAPGTISFTNVERILTGNFNDTLIGNGAGQTLTGQGGADTIAGAGGIDTLWGAQGTDTFVFREMGGAHFDRIQDFASGSDKLHLDDAAFTAIGAMGNFAANDGRFVANPTGTAQDGDDRVVFNTSFGILYYDADGSGGGEAQAIAMVQSGATVAATDIVVI